MQTNPSSSLSRLNRLDPDDGLYTIPWSADTDLSHQPHHPANPAEEDETPSQAAEEQPADLEQLPPKFPKLTTLPSMWDLSDL
ncbi:MAG: hypothetical protein ACK2UW_21070 [Anaerolineales bacterium]|jgi:hypothetical protein